MSEIWKNRHDLPVISKLDHKFDIDKLKEELRLFSKNKIWDGLGSDYAHMCEAHTKLPKMFFKEKELDNIESVCDLDWEKTSYQQLSLTEFDGTYDLSQRTEISGSAWDTRIAKKILKQMKDGIVKLKMMFLHIYEKF